MVVSDENATVVKVMSLCIGSNSVVSRVATGRGSAMSFFPFAAELPAANKRTRTATRKRPIIPIFYRLVLITVRMKGMYESRRDGTDLTDVRKNSFVSDAQTLPRE